LRLIRDALDEFVAFGRLEALFFLEQTCGRTIDRGQRRFDVMRNRAQKRISGLFCLKGNFSLDGF
jgi:hypothetical protein